MGLVGCVKQKEPVARPAEALYTSPLFRGRRAFVLDSCDRWFILSAKHGLVHPREVLAPYDETLATASTAARRAWSSRVVQALVAELGDLSGSTFEVHAGAAYRDFGLVEGLRALRASIAVPAFGLTQGKQLAFYAHDGAHDVRGTSASSRAAAIPSGDGLLTSFLHGASSPVTLRFFEIEAILGRPLPASARRHRPFWANHPSHPLARQWLAVGWRAEHVDLADELIRLVR